MLGSRTASIAQVSAYQHGKHFRSLTSQGSSRGGETWRKIGDSPLSEAPPFRTLHERYPVEDLAESFAEGIRTGHPSMPEWRLDAAEINDLIAYLKTL